MEDPEYAITQLAQTTMRSEIGKIALDTVFRERESLNIAIVGKGLREKKKQKKIHHFCFFSYSFIKLSVNYGLAFESERLQKNICSHIKKKNFSRNPR